MSLPNHGANPAHLTSALGLTYDQQALDFSVNTNPFGMAPGIKLLSEKFIESASNYPEPYAETLTKTVAVELGVNKTEVLVGNGAAELLFHIAHLYQGKKVLIPEPTFSEYRQACEANGCDIESLVLDEPWKLRTDHLESRLEEIDLLFICSPNNPTGVTYTKNEMNDLLTLAKEQRTKVVIDEAFFDFQVDEKSVLAEVDLNNVIIIRSMTKMYGIAGVRLGYVIADQTTIEQLKRFQPPWSVNGFAQKIGLTLLDEKQFVKDTAMKVAKERIRVKRELEQLDFCVFPSVVNFYLLSEKNKRDLQPLLRFLIQHSIIPRHTYSFIGLDGKYLRLSIKRREENEQLIHVLKKWRLLC
ncbi:threonine-phosphate decarboxylase CobD [Bacillus sp. FJAT-45037]|uniref:threonine-phosphate decarboxylase CobD n=1 Tax=Bacillus sp. FJAT-45037 TaxID=2011007 RepID=UPI0012FDA32D|nr:threonine-phosphate decarboxylase CobD [Bacillus sp. FJAT-45037]